MYLGALMAMMKRTEFESAHEWRLQVEHEDDGFRSVKRADGVCCYELPVCTPEIVTEIILGPKCSVNEEEIRNVLDEAGMLRDVRIRRVNPDELTPVEPAIPVQVPEEAARD